jgi:hypothetical protein
MDGGGGILEFSQGICRAWLHRAAAPRNLLSFGEAKHPKIDEEALRRRDDLASAALDSRETSLMLA